jgi:hypothetical protein
MAHSNRTFAVCTCIGIAAAALAVGAPACSSSDSSNDTSTAADQGGSGGSGGEEAAGTSGSSHGGSGTGGNSTGGAGGSGGSAMGGSGGSDPGSQGGSGGTGGGTPSSYSIVVASDCHYGAGDSVNADADSTHTFAQSLNPDAYVLVGDMVNDPVYYHPDFANGGWAQSMSMIHPTVGNHDWQTDNGAGYESFWPAAQRGPDGLDYYTWTTPTGWLAIHMNFKEGSDMGVHPGQSQYEWLKTQLGANPGKPIVVFFHDHRFSDTSDHADDTSLVDVWDLLIQSGADLFISGHSHVYERFPLMDADGYPSSSGIRQLGVGTCGMVVDGDGNPWYPWSSGDDGANQGRSEYRQNHLLGVMKLELQPHAYSWTYYVVDGSVLDSGTQATHH